MPFSKDYHIINSNRLDKNTREVVVMTPISDEEETLLDEGRDVKLKRGEYVFLVEAKKLYCYGEVDFHDGSEDLKQINDFNFLDHLNNFNGATICSDYDYEHHVCNSPVNYCRFVDTWQPAKLCQYAHGCLNKPDRIALFKTKLKNG